MIYTAILAALAIGIIAGALATALYHQRLRNIAEDYAWDRYGLECARHQDTRNRLEQARTDIAALEADREIAVAQIVDLSIALRNATVEVTTQRGGVVLGESVLSRFLVN